MNFCTELELGSRRRMSCTYCMLDENSIRVKAVYAFAFEENNFKKLAIFSYTCNNHREKAMLNLANYYIVSNSLFLKKIRLFFNVTNLYPENINYLSLSTTIGKNLLNIVNNISLNSKFIKE